MRFAAVVSTLALLLLLLAEPALAKAERIVSLNLCADQILLELAEPEHIAALSFVSRDPYLSYHAAQAERFPVARGSADEVLLLQPDIVLAGTVSTRSTVSLLRRLGVPVLELPVADSLAAVREQIRQVGAAIGEEARAGALVATLDARLAALAPPAGAWRPVAAVYQTNGHTIGAPSLIDDLLAQAGLVNLAPRVGLGAGGYLSLERLLAADPDVLLMERYWPGAASLGQTLLRHPALKHAIAQRPTVFVPSRLWICGGGFLAEAVAFLADAARAALDANGEAP